MTVTPTTPQALARSRASSAEAPTTRKTWVLPVADDGGQTSTGADHRAGDRPVGSQRRAHDVDAVGLGEAHGTGVQDLGAARRHGRALRVRQLGDETRAGNDVGVGGVDTVDVGVDLAMVGADGGSHGDGGEIRAVAPEHDDAPSLSSAWPPATTATVLSASASSRRRRSTAITGPDAVRSIPMCGAHRSVALTPSACSAARSSPALTISAVASTWSCTCGSRSGSTSRAASSSRPVDPDMPLTTATTGRTSSWASSGTGPAGYPPVGR